MEENLVENLEALEVEVGTLNAIINELLKRVSKEENRGLRTLPEVEEWIETAEKIETKASSLLDESISERHNLSKDEDLSQISESTNSNYGEKVYATLKEVETHKSKGVFKVLVERDPLSYAKKILPLQPIVSRELLLEKAWNCLMDENIGILGIYGKVGVGKTTLLTRIKNKFIAVGGVSVIFVVVVAEEVESIQDEIGKRLGLNGESENTEAISSEIYEALNRMRFVLLLDGIQRKLDLEKIGVPVPNRENGSKIVFTTRSEEACGSNAKEEVECLSTEESWDLFQKAVGETTLKSHPDIPQLARVVARKCGGLPIALILIGKTMSLKRTAREWHHAIHVLVSSRAEFSDIQDDKLFPVVKFTYDNLPSENIKLCFLYCALFPRNCDIRKGNLVDYWIGEGIIEEEDREIAEIQGYEMINDLVMIGLLMEDESGDCVQMHGMVHEVALWIASDFGKQKEQFVVVGGKRIQEMPEVNDWGMVRKTSVISALVKCILIKKINQKEMSLTMS